MSLADRLPAVVSLVLCGHLAAVLGYSGAFSGLLMHDSPWFAYIGRVYIFALAAVFGMTMWVTFVAGIVSLRGSSLQLYQPCAQDCERFFCLLT
jgi:hypothetical protein